MNANSSRLRLGVRVTLILALFLLNVWNPMIRPVGAAGFDFSFGWMTDTQFYSESHPAIYNSMTQWLANNKDAMQIKYVMHTGDIVNVAATTSQWQAADHSMKILESANVPYGILAGNHDEQDGGTNYHAYFGSSRFSAKSYYTNYPTGNSDDHYDLISASGMNFVIVYMSYGVDSSERTWASTVFSTYSSRIGILALHQYLQVDGTYDGDGAAIDSTVVVPNNNVWLVVCGHNHGAYLNTKTAGGRTYYELLSDYQSLPNGGNGYEKIFYFDLAHSNVHVRTYSANLDQWGGSGYSYDEFDMPLPQQSPTTYTITASAGSGGTISPSGSVPVNYGADQAFTITTNTGYHISDVSVDGHSAGAVSSYTFHNVTANGHTIAASFTQNVYTLTANVAGTGNVNRNNSGPYHYSDIVQLTAAPGIGWSFSTWSGDLTGSTNPASITINGNKTVRASFTQNAPLVTVVGAYHGARLNWTGVVGALSYNIYYNLANNPTNATKLVTGITTSTYDTIDLPTTTWGRTCYYWVAPVGSSGEAPKSSWGSGSDKVWIFKIEITHATVLKNVAGDLQVNVQYRSRYLGSGGITVGVEIGEYLGPSTDPANIPSKQISLVSVRPIALQSFMSTSQFNFESTSGDFQRGSSFKAWIFLWNQVPSEPGYWEAYADKAELIPITIQ